MHSEYALHVCFYCGRVISSDLYKCPVSIPEVGPRNEPSEGEISDLKPVYKKYQEEFGLQGRAKLEASLDSMPELLTKFLYYDPLVLRNGGSWALEEWDRKTPWFRYRAKHACG